MGAALVGLIVGIVVGLTSMGGGALLTPALIFLGIPPSMAIGSDVLIAAVTKLFGSGAYVVKREVNWPLVGKLALGSLPGAILGDRILHHIPRASLDDFVVYGLGVILIIAGSLSLYRTRMKSASPDGPMPATLVIALFGFFTGLAVMITSVGSGSLLMVLMFRFIPLPAKRLVGSDIVHALILSTFATILHFHSGRVDVPLAMSVLVGSIPGVLIGARLAGVLPERSLRASVAAILVFVGVLLLSRGAASSRRAEAMVAAHVPAQAVASHVSSHIDRTAVPVSPVIAAELNQ